MAVRGRSISYRLRAVTGGSLCVLSPTEVLGVIAACACGNGSAGKKQLDAGRKQRQAGGVFNWRNKQIEGHEQLRQQI
ncbi:hypothetical protein OsI_38070 [Oryza sativa Indica Group]|uniref:Uncharacterized protein n=1 Tax=Oryza sativa subsp. indica TaxID=39946 RepID=B8BP93_ORYSI|nr:hypothetical protein OsI_38070 [Oryza sativa Indica Group]